MAYSGIKPAASLVVSWIRRKLSGVAKAFPSNKKGALPKQRTYVGTSDYTIAAVMMAIL